MPPAADGETMVGDADDMAGYDDTMPSDSDVTTDDGGAVSDDGSTMDGGTMPGDDDTMATSDGMTPVSLDDGLTRSPQPPVYADSAQDTLSSLLTSDEAVFSALSAAIHADYAKDGVVLPNEGVSYVKSISGDGEGGFHVTSVFNGKESTIHFEAGDFAAEFFGYSKLSEDEQDSRYLALWDRDWLGDQVASDYLELGYWAHTVGSDASAAESEQSDTLMHLSWVTFGVRSEPDNLPTGSAAYEGQMTAAWWDAKGPPDTDARNRCLRGTVNLEANFGAGTISGSVDHVFIPNWNADNEEGYDLGAIRIAETGINEAQFRADWVGEDDRMDVAPDRTIGGFTGTVLGEFYGPAAEEVGGVLSGRRAATDAMTERYITGGFGAVQPDPEQ